MDISARRQFPMNNEISEADSAKLNKIRSLVEAGATIKNIVKVWYR